MLVGLNTARDGNNDGSDSSRAAKNGESSTLLSSLLIAMGLLTQAKHGSWRFLVRRARSLGLGLGLRLVLPFRGEAEFWCRRSCAASAVSRLPATLALRSDTKRRRVSSGDDGGQSDVLSFIGAGLLGFLSEISEGISFTLNNDTAPCRISAFRMRTCTCCRWIENARKTAASQLPLVKRHVMLAVIL